MRKLNYRFLLFLVCLIVTLSGGIWLVHCLQQDRIAQTLLWHARRAEEQGKLEQSARYLSRYLEFVKDDLEERAHLGRTLADEKLATTWRAKERALFVLETVINQDPERNDLRRLLVPLALDLKRTDLAEEHLRKLTAAVPGDAGVDRLSAQLAETQNQFTEAVRLYRKAIERSPKEIDCYARLVGLLLRQADPARQEANIAEAEQTLDLLVRNNPDSFRAYLMRWDHRKNTVREVGGQRLAEAAKDVARAKELAPGEADVLLAAAEVATARKATAEARALIEQGLKQDPANGRLHEALVTAELQAGHRREARDAAREAVRTLTGSAQLSILWTLGNLLLDAGEVTEAEEVIAQIQKLNPLAASTIDYLRGRVLLRSGKWSDAARLLERTRATMENAPLVTRQIDLFLAQCYEQLDEPGQRQAALGRVLSQDKTSIAALLGLAETEANAGRLDDAIQYYRRLSVLPDAPKDCWIELARLVLVRTQQREPHDWSEAEAALRQAEQAQQQAPELVLLNAELHAARNDLQQAEKVLTEARDGDPKQVIYWTGLSALAESRNQPEQVRRILDEAARQTNDSVALRLANIRYWTGRQSKESVSALSKLRAGIEQFSREDQSRLLRTLAEAHFRLGEQKLAQEIWEQLAAQPRHQNDLRLRLVLFHLALETNDHDTLRRVLTEIKAIEGTEGAFYRYCEASRLLHLAARGDKQGLDAARTHLDAVLARRPVWPAALLAKAHLDELRGNWEQAIMGYRKAADLGERNPRTVRQLVQLLYRRQRFDEADQELRKLQRLTQLSADLQRLAAQVSLRNQDPLRAVELALQAVPADSKDYREHLWLGQTLAASKQRPGDAEQHLRKAVEMAGQAPETWIMLTRFLVSQGRAKDAETVFEQARSTLPKATSALALALCSEALGKTKEAGEFYQTALTGSPNDMQVLRLVASFHLRQGRTGNAEECLRRVLADRSAEAASSNAWARRSLAVILAGSGFDYGRFQEALELVGLRLETGKVLEARKPVAEEVVEENRTRVRVLATQGTRPIRGYAIGLLEDLSKRQALTPDDRFLLARLYEGEGNWPKARELLRELTTDQKGPPVWLTHFARGLIQQRQVDDALRCVEQLEKLAQDRKLEPGSIGTVELRVMALEARAEVEKALELLTSHVRRPGARPEEALILAGFLARHNRVVDALDVCEKAWETCQAEVVAGTAVAVLRTGAVSPEQSSRVETQLLSAIKKNPKSTTLLLQLADLRDSRGQFAEAEALYRQVLDREPRDFVAANNLAWLLAQRPGGQEEALRLIGRAIEIAGPRPELLDTRATVFMSQGQIEPAVVDLEQATRDGPTGSRYFRLAGAYKQANKARDAVKAWRQAKLLDFQPDQLHPVERVKYQKLAQDMESR